MPVAPEDVPTRGVINVIARGPTDGDSHWARKSYAPLMENVLFQEVFNQIQLEDAQLEDVAMPLFGFARHAVHPVEHISLPLALGKRPSQRTSMTPFLIMDTPSTYNVILG